MSFLRVSAWDEPMLHALMPPLTSIVHPHSAIIVRFFELCMCYGGSICSLSPSTLALFAELYLTQAPSLENHGDSTPP